MKVLHSIMKEMLQKKLDCLVKICIGYGHHII